MRGRARRWREPQPCPGCGRVLEQGRDGLCDPCFRRAPWPFRKAIIQAREERAPHLIAAAITAAGGWLKANPPGAETARRLGEGE